MAKKRPHGLGETQMVHYWRQGVYARAGHRCEYHNCTETEIQAHHVVKRRIRVTRYDPWNGVALCARHHQWVEETLAGSLWLASHLGPDRCVYLDALRTYLLREVLLKLQLSEADWMQTIKAVNQTGDGETYRARLHLSVLT